MDWSFLESVDWVGVSGLIIALAALLVARNSLRQNQKHLRLSVKPHLTGHYITTTDEMLALHLENDGLGPAVIKRWEVWFEDNEKSILPIESSTHLIPFIASQPPLGGLPFRCKSKKRDSILSPGRIWPIFELQISQIADQALIERAKRAVEQISVRVTYQSVYEDAVFVETVSRVKRDDQT